MNVTLFAIGAAATVMLSLALVFSPIVGLVSTAAIVFAVWSWLRPSAAASVLAFLTAAFPKAGVKVGDFPLPVFLFGLFFAVLLHGARRPRETVGTLATLLTLLWLTFVVVRFLSIETMSGFSAAAAFAAWTAGPIVLLYLAVQRSTSDPRFRRCIETGFVISVLFGLVQLVGGVERTAVAGLTYALGDDLTQKNNVIYTGGVADYSKIPSTYQNGNIYGLVAAGFFAMALSRIVQRRGARFDYVLILASGLAIALSGSRTAIIAATVAVIVVVVRGGQVAKKLWIMALIAVVGVIVVALQPGLVARYSIDNVLDSGGAGRSEMWSNALSIHPIGDYILGAPVDPQLEGWLGLLLRIGWVGVALLVVTVGSLLRGRPQLRLPVLVLVIGAVIDSSYLLFPTWFVFAALAVERPVAKTLAEKFDARRNPGKVSIDKSLELVSGK